MVTRLGLANPFGDGWASQALLGFQWYKEWAKDSVCGLRALFGCVPPVRQAVSARAWCLHHTSCGRLPFLRARRLKSTFSFWSFVWNARTASVLVLTVNPPFFAIFVLLLGRSTGLPFPPQGHVLRSTGRGQVGPTKGKHARAQAHAHDRMVHAHAHSSRRKA